MKKLLFVRGFTLSNDKEYDEYKQIYAFFRMSKYKLEYFKYTTEERLDQVYKRLEQIIKKGNYSVLMGHSMGGGLLSRFCRENDVSGYEKIILLMPFIRTNPTLNRLLTCDFAREWRIPKAMILPQSFVEGAKVTTISYIVSALLHDSFAPIGIHQCLYSKRLLLTDKEIIRLFKKNIHLIHSPTDELISFAPELLSRIKNQYSVEGGHLSFSSKKYDNNFFDTLYNIISGAVAIPPYVEWTNDDEVITERNSLQTLCNQISSTINDTKNKDKITDEDKGTIEDAVRNIRDWLDKNPTAENEEISSKKEELESTVRPILSKLYQGSTGGAGGIPGGPGFGGFQGIFSGPQYGTSGGGAAGSGPTVEETD